jgi:hypothetical protein
VVAAGLFVERSNALSVPLGFDAAQVLVATVGAGQARIESAARLDLYQKLVDAVAPHLAS